MAEEEHVFVEQKTYLETSRKDWGSIVNAKPCFTSDSKYILVPSGCKIKVFSLASGELLQELSGHTEEVVSVMPHMKKDDEFYSCDVDGNVFLWNPAQGLRKESYKILIQKRVQNQDTPSKKVTSFLVIPKQPSFFMVLKDCTLGCGEIIKVNPPYHNMVGKTILNDIAVGVNKIAISFDGLYVFALQGEGVVLKSLEPVNGKIQLRKHLRGTRIFTCIASHPTKHILATGDNTGRILLWYNFIDKNPTKETLHWHTLPIADLAFSATGNELFSGAGECTLVKWQLTEERRSYLPRLGMPFILISTDRNNDYIITSHCDNALNIISAKEFKVIGVIQGFARNVDRAAPYAAGILYDPRTQALIMNGRVGHLQFYDVHNEKQIYHLDITLSNYITQERNQELCNTDVVKIAISSDGLWLVTVEYRNDFTSSFELRLKFWQFIEKDQSWRLNTSIEMPHCKSINTLALQPIDKGEYPMCITGSDDNKFKLWGVVDDSDIHRQNVCWNCEGVGFYRHLPCTAANFSPDGSLVAAGFGSVLTFWVPETCQLKGTLSQPFLKENILQVEYGQKDCSRLILTRTDNWICAWDLFSLSLKWRVNMPSTCIAMDSLSSYMAVFSKSQDVLVFKPSSPKLYCGQQKINKNEIISAAFVPNQTKPEKSEGWNTHSSLYFIDSEQSLHTVNVKDDDKVNKTDDIEACMTFPKLESSDGVPTPFKTLIAQSRVSEVEQVEAQIHSVDAEAALAKITKILDETQVFHIEAFPSLVSEVCSTLIPLKSRNDTLEGSSVEKTQRTTPVVVTIDEEEAKEEVARKLMKKEIKKELARIKGNNFNEMIENLYL
ncbi:WD repeat-containing protein l(2)05287 [Oratosquilla oratoria]|uniref:WD repeat-containing protein l(2)05287 n=1 Tax=Oratosquilla oratoria TaxID=337810 RepID=UPI003F75FD13